MLKSSSVPSSPAATSGKKGKHVRLNPPIPADLPAADPPAADLSAADSPAPRTPQRTPHAALDASFASSSSSSSSSSPGLHSSFASTVASTPAFGTPSTHVLHQLQEDVAFHHSPMGLASPLSTSAPSSNAVKKQLVFDAISDDDDATSSSDVSEESTTCGHCDEATAADKLFKCGIQGRDCYKYPVCRDCRHNKHFKLNPCDGPCDKMVCTSCRTSLPVEEWMCGPCGTDKARDAGYME